MATEITHLLERFEAFEDRLGIRFESLMAEWYYQDGQEVVITVRREAVDSRTRLIRLASSGGVTTWTVIERDGIALAFVQDDSGVARLEDRQAVVHAFLPTLETTGFPFKVNGDISTDPSRTRIILDERTASGTSLLAKLIVDLLGECLNAASPQADAKLLSALIPVSDPRRAGFQRRGFKTELYAAIKCEAGKRFESVLGRPPWLNAIDFPKLTETSGAKAVPRNLEGVEGLSGFLRFLGARDATRKDCSAALGQTAEIVTHLTNLHATKQIEADAIKPDWKLWPVGEMPHSLDEATKLSQPLANSFTDLIAEKSGNRTELPRMLESLTSIPSLFSNPTSRTSFRVGCSDVFRSFCAPPSAVLPASRL